MPTSLLEQGMQHIRWSPPVVRKPQYWNQEIPRESRLHWNAQWLSYVCAHHHQRLWRLAWRNSSIFRASGTRESQADINLTIANMLFLNSFLGGPGRTLKRIMQIFSCIEFHETGLLGKPWSCDFLQFVNTRNKFLQRSLAEDQTNLPMCLENVRCAQRWESTKCCWMNRNYIGWKTTPSPTSWETSGLNCFWFQYFGISLHFQNWA